MFLVPTAAEFSYQNVFAPPTNQRLYSIIYRPLNFAIRLVGVHGYLTPLISD